MDETQREPRLTRTASVGALSVLPIFVTLAERAVVVAGGSPAATWKAELLAAAGARVAVFADQPCEELRALASDHDRVTLQARRWRAEDLVGAAIAVADLDGDDARDFVIAARAAGAPVNLIDQPGLGDFQFGVIVERTPLVVGVSTGGAAPVLAQAARARIEAVLPQSLREWAQRASSWRPNLRARRLDPRLRRRFWSRFAAQAFESRARPPAHEALDRLVAEASGDETTSGSVALVGAGPGDPELLTLKAVRALQGADVVLYDDLASPETVAMARRESQKITVGKRGYKPSCTQEDISNLLIDFARQGKRVVRLKGGDPCLFGRANEEIDALRAAGVPVEVIPGVTAASAAAASLGRSLTERSRSRRVQFITAHASNGRLPEDLNWAALADSGATTAVYMGLRTLPDLVSRLLEEGLSPFTPSALVENASLPRERRVTAPLCRLTEEAARSGLRGPCLALIGAALEPASDVPLEGSQQDRPPS